MPYVNKYNFKRLEKIEIPQNTSKAYIGKSLS